MGSIARVPAGSIKKLYSIMSCFLRKAINFDLDEKAIKDLRPGKSTAWAYSEIRSFLESHGFSHRQYSGYLSQNPMQTFEVVSVLEEMRAALPWFETCAKRCDITSQGVDCFDYVSFMREEGRLQSFDSQGLYERAESKVVVRDVLTDQDELRDLLSGIMDIYEEINEANGYDDRRGLDDFER